MFYQYYSLLKDNSNYRYLWLAFVTNQLGDWFNLILLSTLVYSITNSGVAVSYLFLVRFIPQFLFAPIGGVLADKYSRKKIMVAVNLFQSITVIGFLFSIEFDSVNSIYLLSAVLFSLYALYEPASMAIIPTIVKKDNLVTASTLHGLTWSVMLTLGAFLGGIVTSILGATLTLVINMFIFLLAASFLLRIQIVSSRAVSQKIEKTWLNFLAGLRYLKRNLAIMNIAVLKAIGTFCWAAIPVLEVIYAKKVFVLGENGTFSLGIFYAIAGIGTGLGPLVLRKLVGDTEKQLIKGIMLGFAIMLSGILISALSSHIVIFSAGILIRTLGTGTIWVFSTILLQLLVIDKYRGRVFSFEFAIATLTQTLSIYWVGLVTVSDVDITDLRFIMLTIAFIGFVGWGLWQSMHYMVRGQFLNAVDNQRY